MSEHERAAMALLGDCAKTPQALADALQKHGIHVASAFGLLVGVCELGSLCSTKGSVGRRLAVARASWRLMHAKTEEQKRGLGITDAWVYHTAEHASKLCGGVRASATTAPASSVRTCGMRRRARAAVMQANRAWTTPPASPTPFSPERL